MFIYYDFYGIPVNDREYPISVNRAADRTDRIVIRNGQGGIIRI